MIKSFEDIKRNTDGLYELGEYTFRDATTQARLFAFDVTDRHAGRPDMVSNDVYGTTDEVELICDLNNIVNPQSIKQGDVLIVCLPEDAPLFYQRPDETAALRDALINPKKGSKVDRGRQNYIDKTLAASFMLPSGQQAIREENGRIKIFPV